MASIIVWSENPDRIGRECVIGLTPEGRIKAGIAGSWQAWCDDREFGIDYPDQASATAAVRAYAASFPDHVYTVRRVRS